jgi:hypothetical protein
MPPAVASRSSSSGWLRWVFGGLQLPGPGFVAPALAVYLVIRRLELPFTYPDFRQLRLEAGSPYSSIIAKGGWSPAVDLSPLCAESIGRAISGPLSK